MPHFKKGRKSERWAISRQKRKKLFPEFEAKRFKPLVSKGSTPEKEFPGSTRLHELEKALPEIASGEDAVRFIIEDIGKRAAVEFIRDNVHYLGEAWLKGVNNKVFDPILPLFSKPHSMKGWTKSMRTQTRKNPYKVFQETYRNLGPNQHDWYTASSYLMTIYKMAEKEAPKIFENYRENTIALLEERGIPFNVKILDIELKKTSNKRAMRGGIIETPEKIFRDAERFVVQINEYKRHESQFSREKANEIARKICKKLGLSWTKKADRETIRLVSADLAGRIMKEIEKEKSSDKKRGKKPTDKEREEQRREDERKEKALENRAITLIGKELSKRDKANKRRGKKRPKEPQNVTTRTQRKAAQRQRHRDAEAARIRAQRIKEKAEKLIVEQETKATTAHSQSYRRMRRLQTEAPNVYQFIRKHRKSAGIPPKVFEDLVSKMLIYKLPQRATHEALTAGFGKTFPAPAMPALIYILTEVGNLARRASTLESRAKNKCQKLDCQSEFVKPVITFLLKNKILEKHHAPSGQGLRISISRKFN